MSRLFTSTPQLCDVWEVQLAVNDAAAGRVIRIRGSQLADLPATDRRILMMNYCSVGNDAELVFEVEKRRRGARWINRVLYMLVGIRNVLLCVLYRPFRLLFGNYTVSSCSCSRYPLVFVGSQVPLARHARVDQHRGWRQRHPCGILHRLLRRLHCAE